MKRTLLILASLVVLAAAAYLFLRQRSANAPAPGILPDIVVELPAGAPVIAYADLASLRASPFWAQLEAIAPSTAADAEYQAFVRQTGFDYTRDLDHAALALWPDAHGSAVIAIAEGRFDRQRITQYALRSGKVRKDGAIDVYEMNETVSAGPDSKPVTKTIELAFLAPNRIALGEGVSLAAILDRSQAPALVPAQRDRLSRIAGASFFATAGVENLPRDLSLDGMQSDQLNRLLRSIQYVSLAGKPEGKRLTIAVDTECDSVANALELSTLLGGLRVFGRAALADPKTRRQLQPQAAVLLDTVLRAGEISPQGKQVRIRLDVTPQMLEQVPSLSPRSPAPAPVR